VWDPQPVSGDFDHRLYARIATEEQRSFWSRLLNSFVGWKPAIAGAMAAIALLTVLLVPKETASVEPGKRATEIAARTETLEPEQIERALEDLEMLRQLNSASANQPTPVL